MCFYIDKCLDCQTKTNGAPYCVPCLWKQYELKCSQLAAAEKELFELQTCMSGRFWMCMKCQRITHSHNCVHQCLCGNWPSSGYFASATFGQWELQNQGAFAAWRADRLATYPAQARERNGAGAEGRGVMGKETTTAGCSLCGNVVCTCRVIDYGANVTDKIKRLQAEVKAWRAGMDCYKDIKINLYDGDGKQRTLGETISYKSVETHRRLVDAHRDLD